MEEEEEGDRVAAYPGICAGRLRIAQRAGFILIFGIGSLVRGRTYTYTHRRIHTQCVFPAAQCPLDPLRLMIS